MTSIPEYNNMSATYAFGENGAPAPYNYDRYEWEGNKTLAITSDQNQNNYDFLSLFANGEYDVAAANMPSMYEEGYQEVLGTYDQYGWTIHILGAEDGEYNFYQEILFDVTSNLHDKGNNLGFNETTFTDFNCDGQFDQIRCDYYDPETNEYMYSKFDNDANREFDSDEEVVLEELVGRNLDIPNE